MDTSTQELPASDRPADAPGQWYVAGQGGVTQPTVTPKPPGPPEQRVAAGISSRAIAGVMALAVLAAGAGVGIGHAFWHSGSAATASSSSDTGNSGSAFPQFPGGSSGGLGAGPDTSNGTNGGAGSTSGAGAPANAAEIAEKVNPAVVDINTTLGYRGAQAAGTGMVLTSTGEVLTNNHVIAGATSISVTDVGNGKTYKANVVGYDRSHDIAVLQLVGASGLATVTTATTPAQVGDAVVGIGNAGGTGGTPSYAGGSITATNQTITATDSSDGTSEQLTGLLETNANIVAGDSGGPLVNTQGEVVGIDTAASAGFQFNSSSQGFAIPIATALQIANQIESGKATSTVHIGATAMLGVSVTSAQTSTQNGLAAGGAVIAGVVDGGPADDAGLAAGDVITAVDGHAVTSPDDLSAIMLTLTPGHTARVTYLDQSGAQHTVKVQLTTGPPQ